MSLQSLNVSIVSK